MTIDPNAASFNEVMNGTKLPRGPNATPTAMQPEDGLEVVAWLVDPGAGSAMDKVMLSEPMAFHYAQYIGRGGSIDPLVLQSKAAAIITSLRAEIQQLKDDLYDARLPPLE